MGELSIEGEKILVHLSSRFAATAIMKWIFFGNITNLNFSYK